MPEPTPIRNPGLDRPLPQRLAAAKLALLHDAEETRHRAAQRENTTTPKDAALDAIREKPLLVMGAAALLGFFLFRKNFFLKRVMTLLAARIGMTAIKRVLK